ncbi:AzlD domain-containing protein [Polynucleobacter antarcticus]|uniref:AzlD domain-containing protein n=1 Tax=Polynucleobacter antarcticus TaxID=1743162 RepID=UPI0039EFB9E6
MSTVELWISFFGLMLVTLITRGFFLLAGSKFHISESVHEFLRYAPTAALIAIVLPELIFMKQTTSQVFELNLYSPQFFGGIAAVMGFLLTKSMLATIFFGMLAFTLARIFINY